MTSGDSRLREVLTELEAKGYREVEVFWKRGRSRRVRLGIEGDQAVMTEEEGWGVRAGDHRASFHAAATGQPRPDWPWPEPTEGGLRLPEASPVVGWRAPSNLESSLIGEVEGRALLESVAEGLRQEHGEARLLRGLLEDGSSEVELLSSRSVWSRHRHRNAALRLWGSLNGDRVVDAELYVAAREARSFAPGALARRLADRLIIEQRGGSPPDRDRGELLLAPEVAARLLAGLVPLFVGAGAWSTMRGLADRHGRMGSRQLHLIDDGRLPGGLFEAPVDGEGVPSREVTLIEAGVLRQPLLPWTDAGEPGSVPSGCRLRSGWRALPATGPTHLFLAPTPGVTVARLLEDVARGYYFIDTAGAGLFDLAAGRFALPVLGFEVRGGRPTRPISQAWIVGGVGALFRGVQATARDLTFLPLAGAVGAPSLLLSGLEVRSAL